MENADIASARHWFIRRALLPEGWASNVRMSAAAGKITAIEADALPHAQDVRLELTIPGMGNVHSHAFQRGMSGLTERRGPANDSFWTWRDLVYRFVGGLDPDQTEAIAAFAFAEMLEEGFTRVGEFHYLHHDRDGRAYSNPGEMAQRIMAAGESAGIALTLLPVFYAHAGFGGQPPGAGQRRFVNDPDSFAKLVENARAAARGMPHMIVGIAPHSLRAVTPAELAAIVQLAPDAPIHIHVAEQLQEVRDCLAWSGIRPTRWLLENAPVDPRWCLIHATHLDEGEVAALAGSGAVAGLCPMTEANLGDGIFPFAAYGREDGRYAIGTDSNVHISMTSELALLEYGQRLATRARNIAARGPGGSTGAALFAAGLSGGDQALGAQPAMTIGADASFVVLDPDHPMFIGRSDHDILDSLIFGRSRGAIAEVWSRGARVVAEGRHVARETLARRYRAVMKTLLTHDG